MNVASCDKADCHDGDCSPYAHRYRQATPEQVRRAARDGKHSVGDQGHIEVIIDGVIA